MRTERKFPDAIIDSLTNKLITVSPRIQDLPAVNRSWQKGSPRRKFKSIWTASVRWKRDLLYDAAFHRLNLDKKKFAFFKTPFSPLASPSFLWWVPVRFLCVCLLASPPLRLFREIRKVLGKQSYLSLSFFFLSLFSASRRKERSNIPRSDVTGAFLESEREREKVPFFFFAAQEKEVEFCAQRDWNSKRKMHWRRFSFHALFLTFPLERKKERNRFYSKSATLFLPFASWAAKGNREKEDEKWIVGCNLPSNYRASLLKTCASVNCTQVSRKAQILLLTENSIKLPRNEKLAALKTEYINKKKCTTHKSDTMCTLGFLSFFLFLPLKQKETIDWVSLFFLVIDFSRSFEPFSLVYRSFIPSLNPSIHPSIPSGPIKLCTPRELGYFCITEQAKIVLSEGSNMIHVVSRCQWRREESDDQML